MPAIHQDIIIDFILNDESLDSTLDKLQKSGAVDKAVADSFKQTQTALKSTSTEAKGLVSTFNQVKTTATQMGKSVKTAFDSGVKDALDEAGVSLDEFDEALKKASQGPIGLRQELKNLTVAIAEAKINGTDLGDEFQSMVKRAGELKDAIADANTDISNMGSDTRGIDNVIGSISAVAGGFAFVQGAAALFGDENEDLQKALLKVNAAMAISQSLQQVSNALTKEGSIVKLADAVSTGYQSAAQRIYTAVTGKATAATFAFKAALLATGIGAIVTLVLSLVEAFDFFSDEVDDAKTSMDQFNLSIERSQTLLNDEVDAVRLNTQRLVEYAKQRGASETELNKIKTQGDKYLTESYAKFADQQIAKVKEVAKQYGISITGQIKTAEDARKIIEKLQDFEISPVAKDMIDGQKEAVKSTIDNLKKVEGNFKEIQKIQNDREIANEELKTNLANKRREDEKKRQEKADADAKKRQQAAKEFNDAALKNDLADLGIKLNNVEKNSQAEVDLKKLEIAKKAEIELNGEKLTRGEINLIRSNALKDQLELQKEFNAKLTQEQIESQISRNNAALQNLNLTEGEKLKLTRENLAATAQLEIIAAKNNSAKILEIKAKLYADDKALFKASLEKINEDEIAATERRGFVAKEILNQLANDEKASAIQRIDAIKSIEKKEEESIDKRIGLLELFNELQLGNEADNNKEIEDLLNKKYILHRDAEGRITEITLSEQEKRKQKTEATVQQLVEVASRAADLIASINALSTESERQRIDESKRQLQELEEAGAITKKNAEIRAKEIEILERNLRQKAAQREKQNAIFRALLAIPQAYLTGLTAPSPLGGPILGAIYAGIAAAEAAIIAARPIPKFAKGKKDSYQGLAEVGEAGSELIEKDGRMFLAPKKTIIYIGSKDKVFTASETKNILSKSEYSSTEVNNILKEKNISTTLNKKTYTANEVYRLINQTLFDVSAKIPSVTIPVFHNSGKAVEKEKPLHVPEIDYEKLGKAVAKHQKHLPSITIDKDFISESVKDGLMKTNYYNKRYKF